MNCSDVSSLRMTLSDPNASGASANFCLKPTAKAKGVALALSRADSGDRVRPGHAIDIRVASTGDISVAPEFIVQYVKTQKKVVPGDVHATATFTIDYQ